MLDLGFGFCNFAAEFFSPKNFLTLKLLIDQKKINSKIILNPKKILVGLKNINIYKAIFEIKKKF